MHAGALQSHPFHLMHLMAWPGEVALAGLRLSSASSWGWGLAGAALRTLFIFSFESATLRGKIVLSHCSVVNTEAQRN